MNWRIAPQELKEPKETGWQGMTRVCDMMVSKGWIRGYWTKNYSKPEESGQCMMKDKEPNVLVNEDNYQQIEERFK